MSEVKEWMKQVAGYIWASAEHMSSHRMAMAIADAAPPCECESLRARVADLEAEVKRLEEIEYRYNTLEA